MLNSPKLIIEFIGLPGSGKTTLSKNLYQVLGSGTQEVRFNDVSRAKGYFQLIFKPVFLYRFITKHIQFLGGNSINKDNFGWILKNAAYHAQVQHKYFAENGIFIYDESDFQRIWSMSVFNSKDKLDFKHLDDLADYLAGAENKLYVLVNIDSDTSINRIINRSHPTSRFNRMSEENVKKYITENYPVYEKIAGSIKSSGRNYLELDGENEADYNVDLILDRLDFKNHKNTDSRIKEAGSN